MICFTKDFEATKKALDVWFVAGTAMDLDELFGPPPDLSALGSASSSDPVVIMAIIKLTMASTTLAMKNRREAHPWASKVVTTLVLPGIVMTVLFVG